MFVKPAQYYLMAETTAVLNRDWGGSGTYADGTVLRVAGIHIVKTNNLPTTDLSSGGAAAHRGNFATTVGLIMHKSSVATVKLLNLAVETEYDIKLQGWWIVAKYAMGHGFIRPEACIELKTS
jgi:coproporphyrinogen III oxidase